MRSATARPPTSARSCSTSRRPACTRATRPACCPAQSLGVAASAEISSIVKRLGPALGVVGLLNVQLAVVDDVVFVLEVNPRASRTVPFASKATGVNLVAAACRLAAGEKLADLDLPAERPPRQVSVKAAVLPFARFPGADPVLGPEMRATGEVMASASDLPTAFAKAERAAGRPLPARRRGLPLGARGRQGRRGPGRRGARRARLPARRDARHRAERCAAPGSRSTRCGR